MKTNVQYVIRYFSVPESKANELLPLCAKLLGLAKVTDGFYDSQDPDIVVMYHPATQLVQVKYSGPISYFNKELSKITNNLFMEK